MARPADVVLKELERCFGALRRPYSLFAVEVSFRARYEVQFDLLEEFDWRSGNPQQLSIIYEPSTFISDDGFKYLLPKVFEFCLKWKAEALSTDFIGVYFWLPYNYVESGTLPPMTKEQRYVLWDAMEYLREELDFDKFEENEWAKLKDALLQ